MSVHTTRLAEGQSGTSGVTVTMYQCPTGITAIVKDIRLSTVGATPVGTILALTSGPRFCNVLVETLTGGGATRSLQPYLVLLPGDELVCNANQTNGIIWWVSGTELAGVA